jgi:hypothetical protein
MQKEKYSTWIEEDKKFLKTNITLREFDKFLCADLEINEVNNEKFLKQGKF